MAKLDVRDTAAKLCGILTELGCEYHFEANDRSKSHYIYVRRPKYMEIRVSDHAGGRRRRHKKFDIGPHGIPFEQAVEEITAIVKG